MSYSTIYLSIFGIFCCIASFSSRAFDVVITESEFNQLHRSCQLFYGSSVIGRSLGYADKFSATEKKQAFIDAEKVGGAWHYCAGLVILKRAQQTLDERKKAALYKKALNEISFTARKVPQHNPFYGEIKLNLARAQFSVGSFDKSSATLKTLLKELPSYLPAYIELARQHDKKGKTQEAIAILNSADEKHKQTSADLNYFIGIYYFKTNDYEKAKQHAKVAYARGYPLPGLRRMLKEKGHQI
ncbi:tetratricopeptide repeat protein [Rheinheimera sp. 4Y26]|uniref:tetratricopeptide repeat protein n=1 Tax=Rheinheimera sp. 4Y26 TaxID=2977811 RepID=UPI0021B10439|nr:hypothetical protein [Rheinheimera sp. 4Y26]MCT6699032.1 hypothetical protein [Rheinheimera sp. 4Y26]